MKIYTFLNKYYDVIEVVKAKSHKSSIKKAKCVYIDRHTLFFSEPIKECLYYN